MMGERFTITCHGCNPPVEIASDWIFLHLRVAHGIRVEIRETDTGIAVPVEPRESIRSYEMEVEEMAKKIAMLQPPSRWIMEWRLRRVRANVAQLRDQQIEAFLDRID